MQVQAPAPGKEGEPAAAVRRRVEHESERQRGGEQMLPTYSSKVDAGETQVPLRMISLVATAADHGGVCRGKMVTGQECGRAGHTSRAPRGEMCW